MLSTGTTVRVLDEQDVRGKLLAAAPRILAENRAMVTEMLEGVKAEILPGTPEGPGHFGIHLRDSYRVEVASKGVETRGTLAAAVQGYWREFGTRGRFGGRSAALRGYVAALRRQGAVTGGGEKAGLYATKALSKLRRLILAYYGKAQWWRL